MVSGLPFLARTGYQAFQAEVFLDSALSLWTEAATESMAACARANGLQCSAFVAHFLGAVFSSSSTLSQGLPLDQVKAAVSIAASISCSIGTPTGNTLGDDMGAGRIFVVPIPAYAWPMASRNHEARNQDDSGAGSRFQDIMGILLSLCNSAGLQLTLELLPGNILGGSAEFLDLAAEPGFKGLRLLFDTGHFWAMGEPVQDLPGLLSSCIVATHLCDNDGIINLSLCPGDGTIPFPATIKALGKAGYRGSMDIEIVCPRESVETEYRRALSRFKELSGQACTETTNGMTNGMNSETNQGMKPALKCTAGHKANQQSYKESP
jgi:sugar phosphate isomerase/epimerase